MHVWWMQMFASEEVHEALGVQSARNSYLKGISGLKYHREVPTDHTVWHLQNEMLYLRALWKPLFPTNSHFKIRFFLPARCHRTDSTILGYHIIFFPLYITNGEMPHHIILTAHSSIYKPIHTICWRHDAFSVMPLY